MNDKKFLVKLKDCIVNFDINGIKQTVKEAIGAGIPVPKVIKGMGRGMSIVGSKYEKGEYFIAELIMAGETMKAGMEILEPYLKDSTKSGITAGKVIIGTVKGDIHDIGKNILSSLLTAAGFKVYDLGVDVPAKVFIKQAKKINPDIVAMSALLTVTMPEMKNVINSLEKTGLKNKTKIIVGGAPVSESFAKEIGADAYAKDAFKGVEICKKLLNK